MKLNEYTNESQAVCRDSLVSLQENLLFRENCQNFPFQNCLKKNWFLCREISDFGLVCRGTKSLGSIGIDYNK